MAAQRDRGGRYLLVIFDMDGTLTHELLNFARIRADIGLPEAGGILEHLAAMTGGARAHAEAILDRHEMAAAEACELQAGAVEVLEHLRDRGVRTALLTRNSAACARHIMERHGLRLDHMATRADLPHKPHPDSILNIVRHFAVEPTQTLMVGDYLYDLQAAAGAGVDAALFCSKAEWPAFANMARYRIRRLKDLLAIVDSDGGLVS